MWVPVIGLKITVEVPSLKVPAFAQLPPSVISSAAFVWVNTEPVPIVISSSTVNFCPSNLSSIWVPFELIEMLFASPSAVVDKLTVYAPTTALWSRITIVPDVGTASVDQFNGSFQWTLSPPSPSVLPSQNAAPGYVQLILVPGFASSLSKPSPARVPVAFSKFIAPFPAVLSTL